MMSSDTDTAARPYHHGALRPAVISAGLRLLAEESPNGLSLRAIARQVGVSAPAVYSHFPDKAALLAALAEHGLEQLAVAQQQANDMAAGGRAGFQAMGEAYVRFAIANPALFRLIYQHLPRAVLPDGAWGRVSRAMTLLLEASASIAPPDQARSFALRSWGVVHGLAMLALDGQIPADETTIRNALRAAY